MNMGPITVEIVGGPADGVILALYDAEPVVVCEAEPGIALEEQEVVYSVLHPVLTEDGWRLYWPPTIDEPQ
jgi:hypothetical protein